MNQPLDQIPFSLPVQSAASQQLWNASARPGDLATTRNAQYAPGITVGDVCQMWLDETLLQSQLPSVPTCVSVLGYNFEHMSQTPAAQVADPITFCQLARQAATSTGRKLFLCPDKSFFASLVNTDLGALADILGLQLQLLQTTPVDQLLATYLPLITAYRARNATLKVLVQANPNPTPGPGAPTDPNAPAECLAIVTAFAPYVDYIGLWATPLTMQATVDWMDGVRAA